MQTYTCFPSAFGLFPKERGRHRGRCQPFSMKDSWPTVFLFASPELLPSSLVRPSLLLSLLLYRSALSSSLLLLSYLILPLSSCPLSSPPTSVPLSRFLSSSPLCLSLFSFFLTSSSLSCSLSFSPVFSPALLLSCFLSAPRLSCSLSLLLLSLLLSSLLLSVFCSYFRSPIWQTGIWRMFCISPGNAPSSSDLPQYPISCFGGTHFNLPLQSMCSCSTTALDSAVSPSCVRFASKHRPHLV